jgi:prevent-host-death family protein
MTLVPCDSGAVRREPLDEAARHLAELADEVERGERVLLTREGHEDLVLVPADELTSIAETLLWQHDQAERAADGEPAGDGEQEPGVGEAAVREKYAHLLGPRDPG